MIKRINTDIKNAMRAKDVLLRDILKFVYGRAKDIAINDKQRELTDADILLAIQRQIKQNKDVINIAKKNGRDFSKDQKEIDILMNYLPKQKTKEEILKIVSDIVNNLPEEQRNPKSRGLVMKELSTFKDVLDMKEAGNIAGELLREK